MSTLISHILSPFRRLLGAAQPSRPVAEMRSLLLFRLENSELLTEILGKAAMNHLVVRLSMLLSRAIRPEDPVQIVSPGLFAVILGERGDIEAAQIARRLQGQAQIAQPVGGREVVPVLTGILIHAEGVDLPDYGTLIEHASQRMEQVADTGLGHIHLYSFDPGFGSAARPNSVSEAAGAGQLVAYFQPQICCNTGAVSGFELLARWNHPQRGLLLPAAFFSRMTDADRSALTLCMLEQGLLALKSWDRAGWRVPTISLNLSHCELSDPAFAICLLWELDRHDIAPQRLAVEVLESVGPVACNAEVRRNLHALAQAGCRIDLDDFGTGYASLDAIRQFGAHRIKIDRSFVTGCDIDPGQQRMILAILALAHNLGISALAEGVETREEYSFLAQMGCDQVQGFAIARPMPVEETDIFLEQHAARQPRLERLLDRGQA